MKPWAEVISQDTYKQLSPEDKLLAQREYFSELAISKSLDPKDYDAAWGEFSSEYPIEEFKGSPWETIKGTGATAWNILGAGGIGAVAGGLAGIGKLLSGQGVEKAAEAVEKYGGATTDALSFESNPTGQAQEQWVGDKFQAYVDWAKNKGRDIAGPEGALVGEIGSQALPLFISPLTRGVIRGGKRLKGTLQDSIVAKGAPEIKGTPTQEYFNRTIGEGVPSPVERVAKPPLSTRVYEDLTTAKPVPPPLPPVEMAPQSPTEAPPAPIVEGPMPKPVARPLPYNLPMVEAPKKIPNYSPKGGFIDTPYLRALKIFGGENHPLVAGLKGLEVETIMRKGEHIPLAQEMSKYYNKLSRSQQNTFKDLLFKNKRDEAFKLLEKKNPELPTSIKSALDKTFEEHQLVKGFKPPKGVKPTEWEPYIPEYYPRHLKDPEGFLKELEKIKREVASKKGTPIEDINTSIGLDTVVADLRQAINDLKSSKITYDTFQKKVNTDILGAVSRKVAEPLSGHAKQRQLDRVPRRLQKYYADPPHALAQYFEDVGQTIAARKYLGKGDTFQEGISNRLATELARGTINPEQAVEFKKVLEDRFHPRVASSAGKNLSRLKNIGYAGTIGNPITAGVQLLDVIPTAMRYGVMRTLNAAFNPFKKKLKPTQTGLYEIAHELSVNPEAASTKALLNNVTKYSGFRAMDRFGKKVMLNAAISKYKRIANSKSAVERLQRKGFQHLHPDDFPQFIEALKKGDINNPYVREAAIFDLLDLQPIAPINMPIWYLRHPNGRVFYMLKTWAIRQLNVIREDIAKGNYYQATKFTAGLFASAYLAPEIRQLILGLFNSEKPLDPEETGSDKAIAALLRMVLLDKYSASRSLDTGKAEPITGLMTPVPANMIAALISDISNFAMPDEFGDREWKGKSTRYFPVIGPIVKGWQDKEKE